MPPVDKNKNLPKPETKTAWLISEGDWKISEHTYCETLECVLPAPDGEAYEFMYRCPRTGVTRRWGVVGRDCPVDYDDN